MENYEKLLEQARGERDAVTKRMIQLECMVGEMDRRMAAVLRDFHASLLGAPCDYCAHCIISDKRCEESDLDCQTCLHEDCECKGCEDCSNWIWRGTVF